MKITNLEIGDLGVAETVTELFMLRLEIRNAANLLLQAREFLQTTEDGFYLTHAIAVDMYDSQYALAVIKDERERLPYGVLFYECDKTILFEVRNHLGNPTNLRCCYLYAI